MKPGIPARALAGGVLCLAVLCTMIVGNAWPLWTGRTVVLAAAIVGKGEQHATGEYLRLTTPLTTLALDPLPSGDWNATYVRPVGEGWDGVRPGSGGARAIRGRAVFVQLEEKAAGVYEPVSVSFSLVPGATNLRGLVKTWSPSIPGTGVGPRAIAVDYGLDAFYLPEGHAESVAPAVGKTGTVRIEVAVASSGHARIRQVLVNGRPLT